jgi:dihydrofolate reductase
LPTTEACDIAAQTGAEKISVIGGGEIYRQAMEVADELLITEVQADIDGDTLFPALDSQVWQQGRPERPGSGGKGQPCCPFRRLAAAGRDKSTRLTPNRPREHTLSR